MFPLIAPPLSSTVYTCPPIFNFVPNANLLDAATVLPAVAVVPDAVLPFVLPQHLLQGQYAVILYTVPPVVEVLDTLGNVGAIGGIKQKLYGADKANADVVIVPFDNYNEDGAITYRFKVKYWNSSPHCKFMSFKVGTLLVIMGSLANDKDGTPIIVAERVEYLDSGVKEAKEL